jgi:hypothetical protein
MMGGDAAPQSSGEYNTTAMKIARSSGEAAAVVVELGQHLGAGNVALSRT